MIPNRALGVGDYIAMSRRRWRMVAVVGLVALIGGVLVCLGYRPMYTSTSTLRVEKPPAIPSGIVKAPLTPIFLSISFKDISERRDHVIALQGQVLSRSNLQGIVHRLGLDKNAKNVDALIDDIQAGTSLTEVDLSTSIVPASTSSSSGTTPAAPAIPYVYATPGFSISFTSGNRNEAQRICAELTSSFLTEDIKSRERSAASTTDFLSRQLDEARNNLDEQDKKFALFKAQHFGQLPENLDDNLKALSRLNAQLEASTQALYQAQQDKEFNESVLQKQLAAWKGSQEATTSDSIERQLATLTTQLTGLQTRYTDDHPEVIKTKSDIARLQAKQKEMNASANHADEVSRKAETPEILQLRLQVQHDKQLVERSRREQKDLREAIASYKTGLSVSPEVEKEYDQLTRDNQIAHTIYEGLLTSKSEAEIRSDMEQHQQGSELRLLSPASFPVPPSFQQRWQFAGYGLAGGLAFGLAIALGLELSNKTMRDEADVVAGAELPMLTAIPWVGPVAVEEGWRGRFKAFLGHKSTA